MTLGIASFHRPFWRWPLLLAVIGFLLVAVDAEAAIGREEARRVALVVGNSEYRSVGKLKNASRDAREIARTLTSLGFEVIDRTDVSRKGFNEALDAFYASAVGADAAVIFYSGHGFQMNGVNYLVPVDATLRDRTKIGEETVRLDDIVSRTQSGDRQTLIFLDACRNNPLPEAVRAKIAGTGLAQLETGSGTFIAFATQPGNITRDGGGDHSPFTLALLKHLPTPGISISDMMIRVRNSVVVATLESQTPWDQSSLRSQFYFNPEDEAEAGGELTEEDREMLLALDPAMRKKFEAKFGIKIEEGDLPAEEEPFEMSALQPMTRIESADGEDPEPSAEDGPLVGDDDGSAYAAPAGPEDAGASANADEDVAVEEAGIGTEQGVLADELSLSAEEEPIVPMTQVFSGASEGPVAETPPSDEGVASNGGSPRLSPAVTVSSDAPILGRAGLGGAAAGRVIVHDQAVTATVSNTTVLRSPTSANPLESAPASDGRVAAVTERDRLAPTANVASSAVIGAGETPYKVATLASAERSVSLGAAPSVSLSPVSSDIKRIVGEEIESEGGAGGPTAAPAARPSSGEAAATGSPQAEPRLAALDPGEIDALSKGPPAKPDEAADAGPAIPAAVQAELARLGCYRSKVDGAWGSGSERALLRYYVTKKIDPDLLDPNAQLLARLKGEETVVCKRTEARPQVASIERSRPTKAPPSPPQVNKGPYSTSRSNTAKTRNNARNTVATASENKKSTVTVKPEGGRKITKKDMKGIMGSIR